MTLKRRKLQGCFGGAPHVKWELENIKYYTCIGNFFDPSVAHFFEMLNKYDQGVLPYPGSFSEQPGKVIEVFQMLDGLKKEKMRQEELKAKQKANRGGKGRGGYKD